MSPNYYNDLFESFKCLEGYNSNEDILNWIKKENAKTSAILKATSLNDNSFWYYDSNESIVRNRTFSFFYLAGIKKDKLEQPIIIQNEVGYLGFIGKKINGVLHFLMQAKIEPGNTNNVQISPTIQATQSNFTKKHGGRAPHYLDYFIDTSKYTVLYDGEEPEQCSRFYKKYNRNVIIILNDNDDLPILESFKWMTIGQIKYFANNYDNLVNMDTRTVLSCLPYDLGRKEIDTPLFNSIFGEDKSDEFAKIIKREQKELTMSKIIRLDNLKQWEIKPNGIFCKDQYPFCFKYFDIQIDGREVNRWSQPLAVANGRALFALAYIIRENEMLFLVKNKQEIGCEFGSCFGPTIQLEAPFDDSMFVNGVKKEVLKKIKEKKCDISTILSEEGGRFYHEENYNVVCEIDLKISEEDFMKMGYYIVNYRTIRMLIEKTHMVNIQLRNLLSLLVEKNEKN